MKKFYFTGSLDAHQLLEILQSQGIKIRLLDLKRGDIRPGKIKFHYYITFQIFII